MQQLPNNLVNFLVTLMRLTLSISNLDELCALESTVYKTTSSEDYGYLQRPRNSIYYLRKCPVRTDASICQDPFQPS